MKKFYHNIFKNKHSFFLDLVNSIKKKFFKLQKKIFCSNKNIYLSFGAPATIPLSIPHSSEPRRILKKPLSPQSSFHAILIQTINTSLLKRILLILTISNKPIWCGIFYTPTKNFNS